MENITRENIANAVWVALFIFGLMVVGDAMRAHPLIFIGAWIACPLLTWLYNSGEPSFPAAERVKMATQFFGVCVGLSILFAICFDQLEDQFGKAYIRGYGVSYGETELDEYGRPYASRYVQTGSSSWDWLLLVGRIVWYALCVGFPWLIWKMRERIQDEARHEKMYSEAAETDAG